MAKIDCDEKFVDVYWDRYALNIESVIKMVLGISVFPDRIISEW
jgi:hypothetical protein